MVVVDYGVAPRDGPMIARVNPSDGTEGAGAACRGVGVDAACRGAGVDAACRGAGVDAGPGPADRGAPAAKEAPPAPLRFGFIGSRDDHDGLWVAVRAAELVGQEHGGWTLQIHAPPVRDPVLRGRLDEAARLNGPRVTYQGPWTREHLPAILARLDVLLIPSLWREAGPLLWTQATAAGVPVVASRIGALEHRVRHGEDGLLCPPGDPAALASAMGEAMRRYPALRRAARKRSVRTIAQATDELLGVYDEALQVRAREERPGKRGRVALPDR